MISGKIPPASSVAIERIHSQQLANASFTRPKDLVAYFGGMQAQDYQMAKFAIGARIDHITDEDVEKAFDRGDILRTHVLRPTWHLVASADIRWMLQLTGGNIKRAMQSSNKALGLDQKIFDRAQDVIDGALAKDHLTREEIYSVLNESGITTSGTRGLHILMHAELSGMICSGRRKNNLPTYALIDERVSKSTTFDKEWALAELAVRYFTSHSPATLKDFTWWSGLPAADAKLAFQLVSDDFEHRSIDGELYYSTGFVSGGDPDGAILLPAFDEFLISYKNRHASIEPDFSGRAFTNNGIFKPVILYRGRVIGTWARKPKKDKIIVETSLFYPISKTIFKSISMAAKKHGVFHQKSIEII